MYGSLYEYTAGNCNIFKRTKDPMLNITIIKKVICVC